jgi:hypothetical protein
MLGVEQIEATGMQRPQQSRRITEGAWTNRSVDDDFDRWPIADVMIRMAIPQSVHLHVRFLKTRLSTGQMTDAEKQTSRFSGN